MGHDSSIRGIESKALDMRRTFFVLLSALSACQSIPSGPSAPATPAQLPWVPDLAVARAPFEQVEVDWKQRIDQAYVFIEARGSYTGIGRLLERVFAEARAQSFEVSGPPFALYFDDPGSVRAEDLRMRACLPVAAVVQPTAPLAFGVLESTTVAYAFVAGPYPEVPRAYPKLFDYMARLNWVENGPIREIYLQDPTGLTDFSRLVTEVQIPATHAR